MPVSLMLKGEGMMLEVAVVDFLFAMIMILLRYIPHVLVFSMYCLLSIVVKHVAELEVKFPFIL